MIWPELDSQIRAFASRYRVPTQAERLLIDVVRIRAEAVAPELPPPNLEWNADEEQLELSWFSKASAQTLTFYLEWTEDDAPGVRALHLVSNSAQEYGCQSSDVMDARLTEFWDVARQAREGAG
jgi:hypothetical protein